MKDRSKHITIYDKKGNSFSVSEDEWRANILPHNIKENWNDPEGLYSLIHMAFKDGFGEDVLSAAQRLKEVKPDERSYSTLGVLQLQQRQFEEAEKTFTEQMQKFGCSSFALNYLAKIYADTGREDQVNNLLLESLRLNPNEENALTWWAGMKNDNGGKEAWRNALKEIAAYPRSWRAQLWLGRDALERNDNHEALRLFKEVLKFAPEEYDALFPISAYSAEGFQ